MLAGRRQFLEAGALAFILAGGCTGTLTMPEPAPGNSETGLENTDLGVPADLVLHRESVMKAAFGTAHARPRYNPYGAIQRAPIDGAIDAYNLGFQTLKIWIGPEITDPSFYFLSNAEIAGYSDFSSALDIPLYRAILSIPFQTVVFEADDASLWSMANTPLTQSDRDRIYQTTYAFAVRLRRDYNGSGRIFVLQNHEGDWHIDPTGVPSAANDPNATGLGNIKTYWQLRQQAVEDARAAQPSDVHVYHLCEVVRVVPSLQRDAPSLTRDVLPQVACDLVGYSAYDSALQSRDLFEQALSYVRSKARVSPTFGTNQVAVTEIGLPEQDPEFSQARKQELAALIGDLVDRGLPYVLFWTMYDNECTLPACFVSGGITSNVSQADLRGYYVRRPDGSFGEIFSRLVSSTTSFDDAVELLYQTVLGRPADPAGMASALEALSSGASLADIRRGLALSVESENNIRGLYQTYLGRAPDAAELTYWENQLATVESLAQITYDIAHSPEATDHGGCVPECGGGAGGQPDGCGGTCPEVPGGCTPSCAGAICGEADGCGGTCAAGSGCCTPSCPGGSAGLPDGCGGTCPGAPSGCTPSCAGSMCGEADGCGGTCGLGSGCCGGLTAGFTMPKGSCIASCGGPANLCHQTDGNVVVYHGAAAVWSTSTGGQTSSVLAMQSDANLVLYGIGSTALWSSGTGGRPPANHFAAIQDDCNLVVYTGATPIWASHTTCP